MLDRVSSAVDAVMADLVCLLRQLQPAENKSGPANSTPLDRAALQADLDKLVTLLRNSDLASLDVYAQFRDRHGAALSEALETLGEAMAELDFGEAARLCDQLQQRYTV